MRHTTTTIASCVVPRREETMHLSRAIRSFPSHVSCVVLNGSEVAGLEIFAEEERLLPPGTSPQRAAEFRLGRRAAHAALAAIGHQPGPILRGSQREPLWPAGFTGSITHGSDHAIAAVARRSQSGGIGIDLESRDRYFPSLDTEIAGEDELIALGRLEGGAREKATIEVFSAKEAVFKAHYPRIGHFFGFDAVRIDFDGDRLVGYFTEQLDPLYPVDRPMEISRVWVDDLVLTWLVLPPD